MHKSRNLISALAAIIVFSLIFACEPGNKQVNKRVLNHVSLSSYFYKRMKGNINNKWKIIMNLTRRDSILTGNYYYVDKGQPIFFSFNSKIDSDNNIIIEERTGKYDKNYNEEISGKFTGKFVSNSRIEGEWLKPGTNIKYKFYLEENYSSGSEKFNLKRTGREYGSPDSGKASIEYIFPQSSKNTYAGIDSINNNVVSNMVNGYEYGDRKIKWTDFDQEMSDFINRFKNFEKSPVYPKNYKPYWQNMFFTSIVFNSRNIIVMEKTDFRFEGGAHPNSYFRFYNYNLKTGILISLKDIFKINYKDSLDEIGEKLFREKYNIKPGEDLEKAGYFLTNHKFHLNDNFAIFKSGLLFKFNPYEIAAYALGAPDVFIPYKDLKNILNNKSILSNLIN